MKRRLLLLLPVCIAAIVGQAKSKLPEIFRNATYVRVEAYNGDAFSPNVIPDDRRAIANVEQQLEDWHRYTLVLKREQAELIFVVRKGRIASATGHLGVDVGNLPRPRGQSQPDPNTNDPAVAAGVNADAGPADDLLEVYIVDPNGHRNGPIWSHTLQDGLDTPSLPLFQQLKHAVDTAYPK